MARLPCMPEARRIWLIYNDASGSNDAAALAALEGDLTRAGFAIAAKSCFPEDPVPVPRELDERGICEVAVFAGDGTIHAVVTGLFGWGGLVHVLPGGTMNLLARRLHGDATASEILGRIDGGIVRKVRPAIIRCRTGCALTGVIAGPGTAWNDVREAMREAELGDMIDSALAAIGESTGGAQVVFSEPRIGDASGYSAATLVPTQSGMDCNGYFARTLADHAQHGVALLQRDFRSGPHEGLGRHGVVRLASSDGEPMGLLIDGEPVDGSAEETFELADCEVDLLASADAA